jgi:hypothetical protein
MTDFRDRTVGELLADLKRYRNAISLVLACILCLTLLPSRVKVVDQLQSVGGNGLGTTDSATSEPGVGGGVAGAVTGGGSGTGGTGGTGGAGTASVDSIRTAGAPVVSLNGVSFPGVGSRAALSSPDCNAATGYLKLQTKSWALPCVPIWPKGADNGGATTRGVTASSITLLVYLAAPDPAQETALKGLNAYDDPNDIKTTITNYVALFNRHAETYGRKIRLVFFTGTGKTNEQARADAINAITRYHPFAATTGDPLCDVPFLQEMALRHVVSLCPGPPPSHAFIKSAEPYFYSVGNNSNFPAEQIAVSGAALIGDGLKGRPAKWAGDALFQTQTRKFGWIYSADLSPGYNDTFKRETQHRGITFAATIGVTDIRTDQNAFVEQVRVAVAKMKDAGVTTVICDLGLVDGYASKEATKQQYFPEWFATSVNQGGTNLFTRATWDSAQSGSYFALRVVQINVPKDQTDAYKLYEWEYGTTPPAQTASTLASAPAARALVAGVMLAGPRLTPVSFRDGLFSMKPIGGVASKSVTSVQQSWGFHGIWPFEADKEADYSGVDDISLGWWDASATCADEVGNNGVGCMMYPDGGRRYLAGDFPGGQPKFFVPAGAVAQYSTLPPSDQPTTYANKKGCATRWECYGS